LRSTHCLCDVLRDIKSASSKWVHDQVGIRQFDWQDGYAAFGVGRDEVDSVRAYILHQEAHHHRTTFEEEWVDLLRAHGIKSDPRYLF
jgi:putative transposase